MNLVWTVSVMPKVFAQPPGQMPNSNHEQRSQNCFPHKAVGLPQWRLDHGHKKCREEKRHGSKDGPLALANLSPIIFQNLVYDSVPTRLRRDGARALCVWIVRLENRRPTFFLIKLTIVKGALLRIDQRVISKRQQGKLARRLLRAAIHIRVTLARQLPICGLDLG